MKKVMQDHIKASIETKQKILADDKFLEDLKTLGLKFREIHKSGGTIYSFGNGGSTCDAMHLTEELVARYKAERPGVKAMHFMDASTLTCWSNDYEFESAYARQAETFCSANDVVIGITTSGNSKNIIKAIEMAKKKGAYTVVFTGKDGGKIKGLADLTFIVPADKTETIQESHIMMIHMLCEFLEPVNMDKQ